MIKSILVALDGSPHADTALAYALWLTERFHAVLVGTHVVDVVSVEGAFLHDLSGSLGFEPNLDFAAKMREMLQDRGRAILDAARAKSAARNIGFDAVLPVGVIANEICDRARTTDLVVLGHRGANDRFTTGLLGGTTESVVRKSPKPVLVSPTAFRSIARPLLAYDGSTHASAAMHAAAEVVASLGLPLRVVHVAANGATAAGGVLDEARRYLQPYGIEVSYDTVPGPAHEGIVGALREGNHDLVFIGAYGHSRLIEMVLGSTTEYVLRNSPCPVFLAR